MDQDRPGRFIVLEGGDGAGRSTQIRLLLPWLQSEGWAPLLVGLGRSALVPRAVRRLRRGRDTAVTATALIYAADLEHQASGAVTRALGAGFTVVGDRWVTTAAARCTIRGADPAWLRGIFPPEPRPDLSIHLQVPPRHRLEREITKRGRPTWTEAGRDLLSSDLARSFVRYQTLLDSQLAEIGPAQGRFCVLDGDGAVEDVQRRLRRLVSKVLSGQGTKEAVDG